MTTNTTDEWLKYKVGEFEGPLDLLLFLIRKNEINIYDIPVSQITKQYLEYLQYSARIDLENITDFYVMASTLVYIKSRMLLPVDTDLDDELDDPRRDLVEKLIEYQKYKKLSVLMKEQEESAEWVIERKKKQRTLPFPENDDVWEEIGVLDLLQTFNTIMGSLSNEQILDMYEEVSINEKLTLINELLDEKQYFVFTDLISNTRSIMDLICAFLAVLEAVKMRTISVLQNKLFGDIRVQRHPESGEDNGP